MTAPTAITLTAIVRSTTFVVADAPDLPNQYGEGFITPARVTITHRTNEHPHRAAVTAYVDGHWRKDTDTPTDHPLGQHYAGPVDTWPDWVASIAQQVTGTEETSR
ncbi:hypothetical protein [Streptomyces sp. NBC_01240]|uniref:hypothetical protein n=1 Tax=Streptomyces sp. NBC_01240 TaxID=2903793 RepID=UPI002E121A19|nr:hypothetical protein OG466_40860 [Streptomyces sp. NBC_01240]